MVKSPVSANHSLHITRRKLEQQEIDRQNCILVNKIGNVNNTVRHKDLEKTWHINQSLKNMISKSNKMTHE